MPEIILDEYSNGHYYVLIDSARRGVVVGSKQAYTAECGAIFIGSFSTRGAAAKAVYDHIMRESDHDPILVNESNSVETRVLS
jgi:hypothetical protein